MTYVYVSVLKWSIPDPQWRQKRIVLKSIIMFKSNYWPCLYNLLKALEKFNKPETSVIVKDSLLLLYKTITSQNVSSDAQVKNFFDF